MTAFSVSRNALVRAEPANVISHVADFHKWGEWSPWEKLDANLARTFTGAASGVGAAYAWSGKKAGAGDMLITSVTDSRVEITLNFTKPMKTTNQTVFTFVPEVDGTRVTWTMSGENKTLFSRLFAKVFNMDKIVGRDFEKGLAALATLV